jgi:hypothetical protein
MPTVVDDVFLVFGRGAHKIKERFLVGLYPAHTLIYTMFSRSIYFFQLVCSAPKVNNKFQK